VFPSERRRRQEARELFVRCGSGLRAKGCSYCLFWQRFHQWPTFAENLGIHSPTRCEWAQGVSHLSQHLGRAGQLAGMLPAAQSTLDCALICHSRHRLFLNHHRHRHRHHDLPSPPPANLAEHPEVVPPTNSPIGSNDAAAVPGPQQPGSCFATARSSRNVGLGGCCRASWPEPVSERRAGSCWRAGLPPAAAGGRAVGGPGLCHAASSGPAGAHQVCLGAPLLVGR
jgi:hypothetical protein